MQFLNMFKFSDKFENNHFRAGVYSLKICVVENVGFCEGFQHYWSRGPSLNSDSFRK